MKMFGIPTNLLLEMSNVVLVIVGAPLAAYAIPYLIGLMRRVKYDATLKDVVHLSAGGVTLLIGLLIRSGVVGAWRIAGGKMFGDMQELATSVGTALAAAGILWMLRTLTYQHKGDGPWLASFLVAAVYVGYSVIFRT